MENLVTPEFWTNRRVFVTGHTGFKGGWLTLWLSSLGAKVYGYALPPQTSPCLFDVANIASHTCTSTLDDIRDGAALKRAIAKASPEIILHLAAQPLVVESYQTPVETYATNIMGTVNLLEAARGSTDPRAIVVVTSDKCYENTESPSAYREGDPLGGFDPYSSSKACAEIVTAAYRRSFFEHSGTHIATVRAGNVFGGGDWSHHRLIPDLLSAFSSGKPALIRKPSAVRPWQHVLEPLAGYLRLTEILYEDRSAARPWNFGPRENDCRTVGEIATHMAFLWGNNTTWQSGIDDKGHEANMLRLDSDLAHRRLGWNPRWSLNEGLERTIAWHKAWQAGNDMAKFSLRQIDNYCNPGKIK